jgi:hypothetical protein
MRIRRTWRPHGKRLADLLIWPRYRKNSICSYRSDFGGPNLRRRFPDTMPKSTGSKGMDAANQHRGAKEMLCRCNFWARAVGVPVCLALCAYLISISRFAPQSLVVYLLLLFLLLVDITLFIPERARPPFVVFGALVLGLCLIEGAALAFVHKPPVSIQENGLLARDPILGWRSGNPGVYSDQRIDSNTGRTIYSVRYTIDANGLRKTISSDHGPTVAFFGDSFTFGLGVKDADTMPQAFANLTDHKLRVLNLGVEGYSPAQFLRAVETGFFDKVIGPDPRLFVFLTSPWQSSRVACKLDYTSGAPRYILENGKPVYAGVCRLEHRKLVQQLLSHVAIFPVIFQRLFQVAIRGDIQLYVAETLKAVALAKERYHVPTIVLFVSAGYRNLWLSGFSDQDIIDQLRAGGAPVIDASLGKDPADDPKLGIPGDGHPTPFAHRARAILLKQYLVTNMPQILSMPHG